MRVRQSKAVIYAVLLVTAFSGTTSWSAELIPLRATYAAISGAFAPLWIAQDKGLFNKYGLNVELKYMLSATGTQSLLSGRVDIVNPGTELVEAGLAGARIAFIIGILNRAVLSVYGKPELKRPDDLRGKTLGVTQPGSTTDIAARMLLRQLGLKPGKDVRIAFIQALPDMITALIQGGIDAAVISAPSTVKLRHAGLKELVDIGARDIPMIHAGLATTRRFIKGNGDALHRYAQAYIEATKVARTDAKTTKYVIAKWTKTDNKEEIEETYATYVKAWEQAPYVSPAAMQTVLDFAVNPTAKKAKPERFIDNSFVAELEQSGFIKQLYK